jgi:hypothetical protein
MLACYGGRRPSLRSSTVGRAALHATTHVSAHPLWLAAGSSASGSGGIVPMDGLVGSTVVGQLPPAVINWVANFVAFNHTTLDVGNLISFRPPHINDPSSIIVGNESSLPVTSVGDTALLGPFYLNNILVTPDIIEDHLSVHRFTTDDWCSMEFNSFGLSVKDLSTQNVITRCDSSVPLYTIRLPSRSTPSSSIVAPRTLVASAST